MISPQHISTHINFSHIYFLLEGLRGLIDYQRVMVYMPDQYHVTYLLWGYLARKNADE